LQHQKLSVGFPVIAYFVMQTDQKISASYSVVVQQHQQQFF
jgi:hypothetical protein